MPADYRLDRDWSAPTRYPDPAVEVLDRRFLPYRLGSAAIERLWKGARWAEGPVWFGEHRCLIRMHRELDNPYPAPAGAQALDNVTIGEIAAGQLIEAARNDKDELTHPSGAS